MSGAVQPASSIRCLISGTAAAASGRFTVTRTISEPASASSMHCCAVAGRIGRVGHRHRLHDDRARRRRPGRGRPGRRRCDGDGRWLARLNDSESVRVYLASAAAQFSTTVNGAVRPPSGRRDEQEPLAVGRGRPPDSGAWAAGPQRAAAGVPARNPLRRVDIDGVHVEGAEPGRRTAVRRCCSSEERQLSAAPDGDQPLRAAGCRVPSPRTVGRTRPPPTIHSTRRQSSGRREKTAPPASLRGRGEERVNGFDSAAGCPGSGNTQMSCNVVGDSLSEQQETSVSRPARGDTRTIRQQALVRRPVGRLDGRLAPLLHDWRRRQ